MKMARTKQDHSSREHYNNGLLFDDEDTTAEQLAKQSPSLSTKTLPSTSLSSKRNLKTSQQYDGNVSSSSDDEALTPAKRKYDEYYRHTTTSSNKVPKNNKRTKVQLLNTGKSTNHPITIIDSDEDTTPLTSPQKSQSTQSCTRQAKPNEEDLSDDTSSIETTRLPSPIPSPTHPRILASLPTNSKPHDEPFTKTLSELRKSLTQMDEDEDVPPTPNRPLQINSKPTQNTPPQSNSPTHTLSATTNHPNPSPKQTPKAPTAKSSPHTPTTARSYLSFDSNNGFNNRQTPPRSIATPTEQPSPSIPCRIGNKHQATIPTLKPKPKTFPISYSQQIGTCVWKPLEKEADLAKLERYENWCMKQAGGDETFLQDRAYDILFMYDYDFAQAYQFVNEHKLQITKQEPLTDEQKVKVFEAFKEFYKYNRSVRELHHQVIPLVPYGHFVDYFFQNKKNRSCIPGKLSRSKPRPNYTEEESESDSAYSVPTSQEMQCEEEEREHERHENGEVTSDEEEEEKDEEGQSSEDEEEPNEPLVQHPTKQFDLLNEEEHDGLLQFEHTPEVRLDYKTEENDHGLYSNGSSEEDAYIVIENEDSSSTTEFMNFENEIYEMHPRILFPKEW